MPYRFAGSVAVACALLSPVTAAASTGQERALTAGASLIGTSAPALSLKTIDGHVIDLGSLYGHEAVYLKFWATWCVPCREQMPHFERTFEHAGKRLAVIAVNAGFNDSLEDVKAYRATVGLKMPIVIDDGRLAAALHLQVTPQHVVIGRDGKILYVGHLVDDRLEAALRNAQLAPVADAHVARASAAAPLAFRVGTTLPNLVVRDTDGTEVPLRDPNRVRPTVLMFISPWCESYLRTSRPDRSAACRRAREQSERLAAEPGVRWVGIASGLWAASEDLAEYRRDNHVTVPLSLDESGAIFRQFGVTEVPTIFVVDLGGTIRKRIDHVGADLREQLAPAHGAPPGGVN